MNAGQIGVYGTPPRYTFWTGDAGRQTDRAWVRLHGSFMVRARTIEYHQEAFV